MLGARARELVAPLRILPYRRLWFAQLVSEVGDWAARLALAALVFQRTGSTTLTGAVTAASLLPWLGAGQWLAAMVDAFPRRAVLVCCDLLRAALFAVVCLPLPVPVVIAAVFVAGLATPPFQASISALRQEVLDPETLPGGLALSNLTQDVGLVAGYLVGGGLLAAVGAVGAVAVNAATFGASAGLIATLPVVVTGAGRAGSRTRERLRGAVRMLLTDRPARRAVVLVMAGTGANAGLFALAVPYVEVVLHQPAAAAAPLAAAAGAVTVGLTAALPKGGDVGSLLRRSASLAVAGGAVAAAGFALPGLPAAVAVTVGMGLLGTVLTPANILVAPRIPAELRAGVYGLLMGSLVAAQAGASVVGGVAVSVVGVRVALGCLAGLAALVGLAALRPLPAR